MKNNILYLFCLLFILAACCKAELPVPETDNQNSLVAMPAKDNPFLNARALSQSVPYVSPNGFLPCVNNGAGEGVSFDGEMHVLEQFTTNANNYSVTLHMNIQGVVAVGHTTGNIYRGSGVTTISRQGSFVNGQSSFSFINNVTFTAPGPGNNYAAQQHIVVTVNANGNITVDIGNTTFDCR